MDTSRLGGGKLCVGNEPLLVGFRLGLPGETVGPTNVGDVERLPGLTVGPTLAGFILVLPGETVGS